MNEIINTVLEVGFVILKGFGLLVLFVIVAALVDRWVSGKRRTALRNRARNRTDNGAARGQAGNLTEHS